MHLFNKAPTSGNTEAKGCSHMRIVICSVLSESTSHSGGKVLLNCVKGLEVDFCNMMQQLRRY